MTQTRPLRGALNQSRNIGHHKTLFRAHTHHTQIGVQGSERVVGNLGPSVRDCSDEGGFARIGHTQQTDISQHFQFQLEVFALTWPTRGFLARRTVDGALKTQVAEAAIATLGNHNALTRREQLIEHLTGIRIGDDGTHRHLERDVVTGSTEHVRAHTVLTTFGFMAARIAVIDQGIQIGVGYGIHVATTPTITAIGAAKLFVFFVPKGHTAIPAIASGYIDIGFIDEFHGHSP